MNDRIELRNQILEAIDRINSELNLKYKYDNPILSMVIADRYTFINISLNNLPEFNIWYSEEDDRKYYEKSDKYENFYPFIKRKFRKIKEDINKYKL